MFKKACLLLPCLFAIVLAGWAPEEQITKNKTGNDLRSYNGDKVVVATNGVRHLVWFTHNSGVLYKRYYPGLGWTSDLKLSSSSSCFPSIALDANRTDIHVVWTDKGGSGRQATWHIFYQKCVPGSSGNGGWVGTPRDITPNGGPHYIPAVACFQDHVVVTWFVWGRDTIGFCECVNGNWGNPIYFDDPSGTGKAAWQPSIAVDPQDRYGDVFISSHVTVPDRARIYLIRRHGGEWLAWEDATVDWDISCTESSVEVDPSTGCPHIVGGTISGSCVYHIYRDPSLGWRPPEIISDTSAISCRRPSMFFSGSTAFVVWAESSSVYGIRYSIGQYGNWTLPDWVTSGYHDDNPHVTASSNGDVYVVWQDGRTSNNQIWGRLYTPGSFDVGGSILPTNEGTMEYEVKEDLYNLTISPNPSINLTTVRYSLPVSGQLSLKLYNVFGREIRTLAQGTHEPGNYNINLNSCTLSQGIYYLKYESGNYREIEKLIVQR